MFLSPASQFSVNRVALTDLEGRRLPKLYARNSMEYLVAVLSDRIQAEAAYTALEKEGFPVERLTILGKGYKSADEFGLIDPKEKALKQARLMAIWLIPFGFFGGVTFNAITGLQTFPWAGVLGNQIIGGVLGAISGGLGSILAGGGASLALGSGDALPYRNRLSAGKYLVVLRDITSTQTRQATSILRQFDPENLQGYSTDG